jgi:hypothetical protein
MTAEGLMAIRDGYLSKTQIKERGVGWTDAGIKRFLGAPDDVTSVRGRRAYDVHWYLASRVAEAEQTVEFTEWQRKSQRRREAAVRVHDARYAAAMRWAGSVEIRTWFPAKIPTGHYFCDRFGRSQESCNPLAILRHNYTNYEQLITEYSSGPDSRSEVGASVYGLLRERVDALCAGWIALVGSGGTHDPATAWAGVLGAER